MRMQATGGGPPTWFAALPRSPLVFRNGMPFGGPDQAGGGEGLALPRPSTVAGGMRAAWADSTGYFGKPEMFGDQARHQELRRRLAIVGPILATLSPDGRLSPFLPTPADALRHKPSNFARVGYAWARLHPRGPEAVGGGNWPHGLRPVLSDIAPDEAQDDAPPLWGMQATLNWLTENRHPVPETSLGVHPGFGSDLRTHAPQDATRGAAREHGLHQSLRLDGRPTNWHVQPGRRQDQPADLVLTASIGVDTAELVEQADWPASSMHNMVCRLGGDGPSVRYRRIHVGLRQTATTQPGSPLRAAAHIHWDYGIPPHQLPASLGEQLGQLKKGDAFRVLLVTPGLFARGWYPRWLDTSTLAQSPLTGRFMGDGPMVRLRAAAIGRSEPVAGVARAAALGMKGSPQRQVVRPTRHLVPAGAVYWFELLESSSGSLSSYWFSSMADDEQDRRDGWGRFMLGLCHE